MRQHEFDPESDVCTKCELPGIAIVNFAVQCGQKWERRGHLITTFATGLTETFHSQNAAKRASRKLQAGQLGYAGMRVIA